MPGNPFKAPNRSRAPRPRASTPKRPRTGPVSNPSQVAGAATPSPKQVARAPKVRVTSKARQGQRMPAVPRVKPPQ